MRLLPLLLPCFCNAAAYNFITFGDWGTGSSLQREGAAAINSWCKEPDACSIVRAFSRATLARASAVQSSPPPKTRRWWAWVITGTMGH